MSEATPASLPQPPQVWNQRDADSVAVKAVQDATGVAEPLARVMVGRGVGAADADAYLKPSLRSLPDPMRLAGLDAALERLQHSIDKAEPIGVFGDYDVDGVTSTTLLTDFFESVGVPTACTIPDRLKEGYGLSRAGVDRLKDAGCRLLVTVDCGVTNHDEILYAKQQGLDVVVVDHHTVPVELPKASAVINPHRQDCTRGSEMLCAVGVTFNLAMALRRQLRDRGWFSSTRPEPDLKDALDLVALGTVADVVPLVGENRVLVHNGLISLKQGKRPGLKALLEVAGVDVNKVGAGTLGFQLGPRVNAAGRLGDAMQGVDLLKRGSTSTAALAAALDQENASRRAIEKQITAEAIAQVEGSALLRDARVVVVGDERWHPGVVGIVASRLVERFGRPAVVVGDGGRGSARSIPRYHLYDGLRAVRDQVGSDVLAGFGGHAHAAGVRIAPGGFERFREALINVAGEMLTAEDLHRVAHHDGPLSGAFLRLREVETLTRAAPFGRGNAEPSFVIEGARLRNVRTIGATNEHIKAAVDPTSLVDAPPGLIEVIAFGAAERMDVLSGPVDLLVVPERNEFRGLASLQLRVKDFRAAGGAR